MTDFAIPPRFRQHSADSPGGGERNGGFYSANSFLPIGRRINTRRHEQRRNPGQSANGPPKNRTGNVALTSPVSASCSLRCSTAPTLDPVSLKNSGSFFDSRQARVPWRTLFG